MELLVIRHAKAEAHGHPLGDAARSLVARGEDQAERIGRFLRRAGCLPDVVLTSPLVRARQTAQRLCTAGELPEPVEQSWLGSGMDPETAVRELEAFAKFERVAIVGHEPDLSRLVAWLLGVSGGSVEVKKASVTGLLIPGRDRRAQLLYHVPSPMQGK